MSLWSILSWPGSSPSTFMLCQVTHIREKGLTPSFLVWHSDEMLEFFDCLDPIPIFVIFLILDTYLHPAPSNTYWVLEWRRECSSGAMIKSHFWAIPKLVYLTLPMICKVTSEPLLSKRETCRNVYNPSWALSPQKSNWSPGFATECDLPYMCAPCSFTLHLLSWPECSSNVSLCNLYHDAWFPWYSAYKCSFLRHRNPNGHWEGQPIIWGVSPKSTDYIINSMNWRSGHLCLSCGPSAVLAFLTLWGIFHP